MSAARDVAFRFLLKGADPFTRFITWVSFTGLLLGVMVLTVVVSVMNGFDDALKERLLSAVPHVVIEGASEVPPGVAELPEVDAAFAFFEGMAMISRGRAVTPVSVFGLGEGGGQAFGDIGAHMRTGSMEALTAGSRAAILGAPLAAHLGLATGDSLALIFPMPGALGLAPVQQRFELVGTFELQAELDTSLVLVALDDLDGKVRERSGDSGVQLRIHAPLEALTVQERVQALVPNARVTTWMQRFNDLFQAVRLEKAMMFVILLLVVAVASFNIVSGQLMLVRKKTSAIAILRTMGADNRFISRVFLLQGLLVGCLGIFAGLLLGVLAARHINGIVGALESIFGVHLLDGTYFVSIPVSIEATDLTVIATLSAALALVAAYLPARRARNLSPIAGLHG